MNNATAAPAPLLDPLGLSVVAFGLLVAVVLKLLFGADRFHVRTPAVGLGRNVVLVTGCDSGFGRALALRLVGQGVHVVAGCFTPAGLEQLEAEAAALPGRLHAFPLDITSEQSVDDLYKRVQSILISEGCELWALVNNAGFCSLYGPNDWVGMLEYRQSIEINLLGTVRMTQKFVPLLKRSRGRVVTMISASGRIHGFYTAPYVTAKFGLEGYMDSVRLELMPFGVTAHVLEPGCFKTQLLNKDAMLRRVEQIWAKLPRSVREEYGEEFRDNFVQQWMSGVDRMANPDLTEVVNAYVHAISAPRPKTRYVCGWDARFLFIPLSFFPSGIQDVILNFLPRLQFMPPLIPAAAVRPIPPPKLVEEYCVEMDVVRDQRASA
ncbi:hypothetical protein M3Y99_01847400 [Aphelenchoides fujianensis]|nr:hypothetical protein M3Y99_01847400 [Aphelenchoides fujianensis]